MIREEEVYLVGKINKPHGTKGELQFTITDDAFMAEEEELEKVVGTLLSVL